MTQELTWTSDQHVKSASLVHEEFCLKQAYESFVILRLSEH